MSSPQQESFQSMATVFILQDKTWIERGSGLVRFVFDLRTFALRLVIRPGTPDEFECKLRPRIRSKGPRAYVVRAQAENGTDEHILAVRFEREEDSRSFRRFVEKRDVDHNQKNNVPSNQNASNYNQSHLRNQTDYTNNSAAVQQQQYAHRHQNRSSSNIAQGGYGGSYPSNSHGMGRNTNPYNNTALGMYNNTNNGISSPSNGGKTGHPSQQVQANYFWTCSRCLQMVDPSLPSCHVCGTLREQGQGQQSSPYNNTGQPQQQQQVLQQISTNNQTSGPQQGHHASYGGHPSQQQQQQQQQHSTQQQQQQQQQQHHHNNQHQSAHHHNPHQQSNATHATYGSSAHHHVAASSMTPSNHHIARYHNNHGQHQAIAPPNGMQQNLNNNQLQTNYYSKSPKHASTTKPSKPTVHILKLTTVNLEKHNKLFPPKRRNVKEIINAQLEYLRTHQ